MKNLFSHIAVSIIFCFLIVKTHAQSEGHLISGEAWLKTNFVEIGINAKGVFGANSRNLPQNFHDNRNTTNELFGFIANPKKDGWLDYDGDFFTPKDAEEGFTITIDKVNYSNNNRIKNAQIPGKITDVNIIESECFEDLVIANWVGSIENLDIQRSFIISENGLFIKMVTRIRNKSSEIKKDVYFSHNLDPDNNVTLNDAYETNLEIVSQPTTLNNIAIVTSSQEGDATEFDDDGSVVSFFANDSRARVTFGGFTNRNALNTWYGIFLENVVGNFSYVDKAMSIAFKLGDLQPGETKEFTYYSILEEVDKSFSPLIINSSFQNPTKCNTTDGTIIFSGFLPSTSYDIQYKKNGTKIPYQKFTSNSQGIIALENLSDAIYSDFEINSTTCNTFVNNTFILEAPFKPNLTPSVIRPSNCEGNNGQIILSNLIKGQNIEISYHFNDFKIPPRTFSVDENGQVYITDLSNGNYSNFTLKYLSTFCSETYNDVITIRGSSPSEPSTKVDEQIFCIENIDNNTQINLSRIDDMIIGNLSKLKYSISYHLTKENAENNIQIIKTRFPIRRKLKHKLFFRMNNRTSNCFEIDSLSVKIKNSPRFQINDGFICMLPNGTTDPNHILELDTGLNELNYLFEWSVNNEKLPDTTAKIIAKKNGTYQVKVASKANGCSINKEVEIIRSGKPENADISLQRGFLTDNQTFLINAFGFGNYEYKLNESEYQNNAIFENVTYGNNYFYINDKNGCGEISIQKQSLSYPLFFTPNDDGINDYWQIDDIKALVNPIIHIMDRYGKLIKTLHSDDIGWDGTYEGKKMMRNNYWFIIYYDNDTGAREKLHGNFSLIR